MFKLTSFQEKQQQKLLFFVCLTLQMKLELNE